MPGFSRHSFGTLIGILAFGFAASSCGFLGIEKKKNKDNVLPTRVAPADGIRWLLPEDPACIDGKSAPNVSDVTIYEWNGSQTIPRKVSISGVSDDEGGFTTEHIYGAIFDLVKNYKCTYDSDGLNCETDKTASAKSDRSDTKQIKICRANGTYDRDSLEGMSLTANYFTETAYGFYDSINSKKSGLVKSVLVPQPRLKMHITVTSNGKTLDMYESDNASFTGTNTKELGDIGLFLVHPTSIKSFDKTGVNLWEVPFVMHHEFGHHVWRHYLNAAIKEKGMSLSAIDSIDGILPDPTKPRRREFGLTSSSQAQAAIDGINETFADLFGYFSNEGVKNQLKGVECLDTTRDPGSATYADGNKKGMDADALSRYEGRLLPGKNKGCATPNFDDEHDIAAALGQPIANFIELSTPNADGKARAQILLNWLTRLDTLIRGSTSNIRVDNIVRELVLAVKEKAPLTADACNAFKANITGLPLASAACVP